ncbi:MAG: adenylate kinase [Bacteroidia bacterium]|nr:adenylate kinase [Bacteroidia bacterium]
MLNIVIFGAPGSGKGTQSELIAKRYGLKHVSTGELLRAEIKAETELGKIADSFISHGNLVPDEIMIEMLEDLIKKNLDQKGFIFDGFPRTLPQSMALDEKLGKNGSGIATVISLEVGEEELIERLLKRGKISGRSDDNRQTIEFRLQVYYQQTEPVKEYYAKQNKLTYIQGKGSIDDIFKSIEEAINNLTDG